jgi:hypothetical protein
MPRFPLSALLLVTLQWLSIPAAATPLTDWMADYQDRPLGELTWPASHDSGMSSTRPWTEAIHCKGGAFHNITMTQTLSVQGQLQAGVRILDIRPVLSGGTLFTAHGTRERIEAVGLQLNAGCLGQSIASVFEQVNTFLEQHPTEVVIIHVGNIDHHAGMFSDASGLQVATAFKNAAEDRLGHLLFRPGDFPSTALRPDVWNMRVGDLVDQNRRVIISMECPYTDIVRGFMGCLPATPGPLDVTLGKNTGNSWANSPHATDVVTHVTHAWQTAINRDRTHTFEMSWNTTMNTDCTAAAFSWKLFGMPPSRLPTFMKKLFQRVGISTEGYDHCRSIQTMTQPLNDVLVPTLVQWRQQGQLSADQRPRVINLDFVNNALVSEIVALNDPARDVSPARKAP